MKKDSALIEEASARSVKNPSADGHVRRFERNSVACPHCGRVWRSTPKNGASCFGFIFTAAGRHAYVCSIATPEERRAIARKDERRWRNRPPENHISNNHDHPGYGGETIWPKENSNDR